MNKEKKIKWLKQALEMQGVSISKSITTRIVATYDKLLIKKGKFNIKDISKIEIAVEKEFPRDDVTYTYQPDLTEYKLEQYKDALVGKLPNRRITIIRRKLASSNINSIEKIGNYVLTKRLLILTEEEKKKIVDSKQGELISRSHSKYCVWENMLNYSDDAVHFFVEYSKIMGGLTPLESKKK